jgi:DNA-binding NtrC family response regulator
MMNIESNNNGSILIVDDEEELRKMLKIYLEHLGYNAVVAEDGQSAIEIFRNTKRKFELVLLDVKMPKIGGKETTEMLKEIDPEVKIILTSGYPTDEKSRELIRSNIVDFLEKPFTLADLSKVITTKLQKSDMNA